MGKQSGLNTALSWYLLAIIALSPIPLGSNRPFFWGLWAMAVGLGGAVYVLLLARKGERFRVPLAKFRLPAILSGLTCLYLVVQILPIAGLVGMGDITVNGIAIKASTISLAPGATIFMLLRQLTYALLFFLVVQICTNDQRRLMLTNALLLIVMGYAAYGLYSLTTSDTLLGMQKWGYHNVATATFVNRNSFATYLGLGAIIASAQIGRLLVRQSERHAHDGRVHGNLSSIAMYAVSYVFLIATLFATGSRMGLASTMMGTLVVAILTVLATRQKRALFFGIPALIVVTLVSVLTFGSRLVDRLENVESDTGVRRALYSQVIELISLRPLTGFGGGAFEQAFPLVHRAPVSFDLIWQKAHSTYLSLWSELGLIVGSFPIIAIAIVTWRIASALRANRGSWTNQTTALATLTLCGVHSLLDFSLEIEAVTLMFVTLVAAGASTATNQPNRSQGDRRP